MQNFLGLLAVLSFTPLLALAGSHHLNRNVDHDALARRVPGTVMHSKRYSNSRWSWYDGNTGNNGACGNPVRNNEWTVALNMDQLGYSYPSQHCFKTITMTYNGKTATATITDGCPGCPYGGLDLTPGLFEYFAPLGTGIIHGEWHFGAGAPPPPPPPPEPTTTWTPEPTTTWTPEPTTTWTPEPTTTWTPEPTTTWTPEEPTTTWTPEPTTTWTPEPTTTWTPEPTTTWTPESSSSTWTPEEDTWTPEEDTWTPEAAVWTPEAEPTSSSVWSSSWSAAPSSASGCCRRRCGPPLDGARPPLRAYTRGAG